MKYVGVLMMVLGVAVGLWCGIWWAFIGGVVNIVGEVRAEHMNGGHLALSILRVMLAGFIMYVSAAIVAIPGFLFWRNN